MAKFLRYAISAVVLFAVLNLLYFVRIISSGGSAVKTRITLSHNLPAAELTHLDETLRSKLNATCRETREDESCIKWRIEDNSAGMAHLKLIEGKGVDKIIISSVPQVFLYLGPSYVNRTHKRTEAAAAEVLGDIATKVERVKR